ncbi:cytochrome c3 family protein [Dethiobacter alkaliphilus]|uniref:Uncharacterized protein n=1 Tax=Dethiobacter alkaliphilus AHT 1 TaxID=555088 RepID=C0GEH0_DETAL|nr:cytochrome c3 family protein [Dethiobacter alkaliphilus]EEG78464.1 hypothetical protein DealDRAFT_0879 [Dethiobacter alkaliphilus AHT 1]
MNAKKWMVLVVALLLMAAFAVGCGDNGNVDNGNDNGNDVVAGPSFGHGTEAPYDDCMACHGDIAEDHEANYGADYEDRCMDCHEAL